MSTKIYGGFRFLINDFYAIHKELMIFREEIATLAEKKKIQVVANLAVNRLDRMELGLDDKTDKAPFFYAVSEFETRVSNLRKTRQRDPEVDFSCNMTIHFVDDKLLGILYYEQSDFNKLWLSKEHLVEEYEYWNNVDHPEHLSDEEWEQREEDWDKALEGFETKVHFITGSPALNGFSAECFNDNSYWMPPSVDEVVAAAKSLDKRVRRVSLDKLFVEKADEFKEKSSTKDYFGAYFRFIDWIKKDDEGKQAFENKMKELEPKLIRNITREDLLKEPDKKELEEKEQDEVKNVT